MEKRRFELHLPGLLKVLAEHLYSTKKVGVRELLQNSHDSCVRRRIEGGEAGYRPRIELALDPERRVLSIQDNGCGLTAEEITAYLATIGRGYTRELREKLAFCAPGEAAELIGQFGLGFLSAFLIASEVTLTTRSFQSSQAFRWHSNGDENYEMAQDWRDEVGTTIELHIKPAASFLLREKDLAEAVRTYADFLPTPIYLEGEPYPLNRLTPPWEDDNPDQAVSDYIGRTFQGIEPLYILQLRDWKVRLSDSTLTVPMQGFLFVPSASVASVREYGDLTVYIRRMFICDRERELLPPWARFVQGVIDCPVLQPTASRESIHQDENFQSIQQALEEQLGDGLRRLAQHDPQTWRRLVRSHSDIIISWAVRDNDFFERVEDLVVFRTTRGLLNLPDYLRQSGGSLYYVTRQLGSLQEQLLAEGRDVPAIEAAWFGVTPFLEKYASRHAGIGLVQLDGSAKTLLRTAPETPFTLLLDYYRNHQVQVEVAAFNPIDVPMLLLYPEGAETLREARTAIDEGELTGGLAGIVEDYLQRRGAIPEDLRGTLYINASCPLVHRLAEDRALEPVRASALMLLYQMARLFAGRMLTPAEAATAFREFNQSLEGILQR